MDQYGQHKNSAAFANEAKRFNYKKEEQILENLPGPADYELRKEIGKPKPKAKK